MTETHKASLEKWKHHLQLENEREKPQQTLSLSEKSKPATVRSGSTGSFDVFCQQPCCQCFMGQRLLRSHHATWLYLSSPVLICRYTKLQRGCSYPAQTASKWWRPGHCFTALCWRRALCPLRTVWPTEVKPSLSLAS
jgi:hypothetical protein